MVTQQEAEKLAKTAVLEYINDCDPKTQSDFGNVLMKLISVTGVLMVAAVGTDEAVERMQETTAFLKGLGLRSV